MPQELPYQTWERIMGTRWPGGTSPQVIELLKQFGITARPGTAEANLALQRALLSSGRPQQTTTPTPNQPTTNQTQLLQQLSQLLSQIRQQTGISTGALSTQQLNQQLADIMNQVRSLTQQFPLQIQGIQQQLEQFTQQAQTGLEALSPQIEALIRAQFAPQRAEIQRIGQAQEATVDVIQSQMAPYAFASTSYENYKASIRKETQDYLTRLDALEAAALAGAKIDLYTQIQNLKAQAIQNYINLVNTANQQQLGLLQALSNTILAIPQFKQAEAIAQATPELLQLQMEQYRQQQLAPQINFFSTILNNMLTLFQGKSRLTPTDERTLQSVVNSLGRTLGITDTQMLNNLAKSLGEAVIAQKPQALWSVQGANEILVIGQNQDGTIGVISRIPYKPPISMSKSDIESFAFSELGQSIRDILSQFFTIPQQ